MKDIIRKILSADLRQQLIRRMPKRIDRLMCKSLLWATSRDAKVLGMPKNATNWGDYWVSKHLERLSLYDKILVDITTKPTESLVECYQPKIRHAYQLDFLNKGGAVNRGKHVSVLQTDAENPLPLPDASVDIIVGTRAFVSLSPKNQLLQIEEMDRILRPGGNVFITIAYFLRVPSSLSMHSDESSALEGGDRLETQLDVASVLEKLNALHTDSHADLSLFPGFEGFIEERVLKLPGLITCALGDLKDTTSSSAVWAANVRCAEIGVVLEKPRLGQLTKRFATGESENNSIHDNTGKIGAEDSLDARLVSILSVFPSILGIRILCLYDDGSEFSGALEAAGAMVHSCVADSDAYKNLKHRYPDRRCWIHDLDRPWSLNLNERYDAVLAFGILDRLSEPGPFIKYVTQLAPVIFIDMPYYVENSKFNKMIDPVCLKDQMQLFDVEVHEFVGEFSYSPTPMGFDPKTVIGRSDADTKMPRKVFFCRRQRDYLEPMLVHVHIPKAAGQAFDDFLSRNFLERVKLYYPEEPTAAQWDLFKKEIQDDPSPLVFSSQSMSMYFPAILGNRIPLYISFFRHPFSMIFSYVKYIKKNYELLIAAHKAILPKNLKRMSIEESVKWHISNGGFFPLPVLELTKGLGLIRAKEIADRFFFTGIVEEMDRSIKLLSLKLEPYGFHFENNTMPRKNTTQDVDLEGYDFHSDKEFQEFARTELYQEVEFYEWVRERFEKEANAYGI